MNCVFFNKAILYVLMVASPSVIISASGVWLEFQAELSYPVHESIPSAVSLQSISTFSLIFFATQTFVLGSYDPSYLWGLPFFMCIICLIPVLFIQPKYKRLAIDDAANRLGLDAKILNEISN